MKNAHTVEIFADKEWLTIATTKRAGDACLIARALANHTNAKYRATTKRGPRPVEYVFTKTELEISK